MKNSSEEKRKKHIRVISAAIVGVLVFILLLIGSLYFYTISPADVTSEEKVSFVVNEGDTVYGVIDRLEKEGLIKNAKLAKILIKLTDVDEFYAGEYELSKSYPLDMTLGILSGITNAKSEDISIQFLEGKRLTYYAKQISEAFGYSEEEILNTMNDKEYLSLLTQKYWFLTDDILNDKLYYPLEGYLFPDTYNFNKNASIKDIIDTMLKRTDTILSPYKNDINKSQYGVSGLLTVASMVELEAVSAEDRSEVAGVFYNRLAKGWTLGSDVTTYYDSKKEIIPGTLTYSDLNSYNGYNTRCQTCTGLPIGPIASVSKSSIEASIKPKETKNMYFVADKNNKLYFAETQSGHDQNIRYLREQGLWLE